MSQEKLALLIDAENISHKYIKKMIKELETLGNITYKRIYRDWTSASASGWKDVVLENGLCPVQQYSYTSGKNATDFAIVIDAMDILYENKVDTFCLATSDSDFTRLAMRLREAGKKVIGLGEQKTPSSFVASCDQYIYLDDKKPTEKIRTSRTHVSNRKNNTCLESMKILQENKIQKLPNISLVPTEKEIEDYSIYVVLQNKKNDRILNLNQLSQYLHEKFPGFRPQNYNCSQLKKLVARFHSLQVNTNTNEVLFKSFDDNEKKDPAIMEAVEREIIEIISKAKDKSVNLGQLNRELVEINKEYSYKKFGYSKFSKFVHELNSIQLSKTPNGKDEVIVINN